MFARSALRTAARSAAARSSSVRSSSTGPAFRAAAASSSRAARSTTALALAGVSVAGVGLGAFNAQATSCEGSPLPVQGVPGTNQERTFLAIKPDGVQRGLVGDIIARFEKRGYKLVGLKSE